MVALGDPGRRRRPPRRRRLLWILGSIVVALVGLGVAGFSIQLPYFAFSPGSAEAVDGLISVPPGKGHAVSGEILLTDVDVSQVRLVDWVPDNLESNTSLVNSNEVLGGVPSNEFQQLNLLEMTDSKQAATVAALRRLGYRVPEHDGGAAVVQVAPGSAASGHIQLGDDITAFDGRTVSRAEQLTAAIHALKPGDTAAVTLQRGDGSGVQTTSVVLGKDPHGGGARLGVAVETAAHFDLPFPVKVNSEGIGGPSAGLAFTLGIVDKLASGDLTGGMKVAATGTMDPEGNVCDVGGVAQKTVAVRDAGAAVFFVPPQERQVAQSKAGPHLHVYSVSNLDQAIADIGRLGGNLAGVPPVSPLNGSGAAGNPSTSGSGCP